MYIEPYGLLDIDVLETYIKSARSASVTRGIRLTYMAIDDFLNNVSTKSIKGENTIEELRKLTGIASAGKATLLYNKVKSGKEVTEKDLCGADYDTVVNFVKNSGTTVLVTKQGEQLSDFQAKFVTHLKKKYDGYRRGKYTGIKFILDLVDRSEIQSTATPYILNRSVEKVMNYQSACSILSALKIIDKRDVSTCLGNISNFEHDFLNNSDANKESRIKSLIAREHDLSDLLNSHSSDLNYLSCQYLQYKIRQIDYMYFNRLLGTDLTERQMHKEFMDLTRKGLVGFNLCTDYLLDELQEHGSNYETVGFDTTNIMDNENIRFIVDKLKPLLEYELKYGG